MALQGCANAASPRLRTTNAEFNNGPVAGLAGQRSVKRQTQAAQQALGIASAYLPQGRMPARVVVAGAALVTAALVSILAQLGRGDSP